MYFSAIQYGVNRYFLKEYVSDDKKHISAAEKAVGFSGGVFAALYLILIGLFGVRGTGSDEIFRRSR